MDDQNVAIRTIADLTRGCAEQMVPTTEAMAANDNEDGVEASGCIEDEPPRRSRADNRWLNLHVSGIARQSLELDHGVALHNRRCSIGLV